VALCWSILYHHLVYYRLNRANYDPMRSSISSLAIGEFGWTQVHNFLITGILTLALPLGLQMPRLSRGGSKWGLYLDCCNRDWLPGAGLFVTIR
jgi:hypothetical protein